MKKTIKLTESELIKVIKKVISETDWYNIEKWDKENQRYVNHLGGNIDVLRQQPLYKVNDVVKVRAFQTEYIGQIISLFVNYDTQEYIYGVRLFTAPQYENGSTLLIKLDADDIIEKVMNIPDNIKNNPRFNK